MNRGRGRFQQAIRMIVLLGTVSAAALASQSSRLVPETSALLCYCHCAYETGKTHCTKMCELPQFENRWWAITCHKKNSTASESSSPATTPGSRKTNRKEQAQQ